MVLVQSGTSENQPLRIVGRRKNRLSLIAVLLLLPLCQSCTNLTREIEQTPVDVAEVQVKIKQAYIKSDTLAAAAIGIAVSGNTVTLTGFVGSEDQSAEALALARDHAPGYAVVNQLETR